MKETETESEMKELNNLEVLENKITSLGWFSGQVELIISLKSEFEGFYNKASEQWERQVIIEIKSPDETKIKNVKVIGRRFDNINSVAGLVLKKIEEKE